MLLVPFILLFFRRVELFLRRYPTWRRAGDKVRRYETAALIIFVAVPLPFTGAGFGSLIAYLFNFRVWDSFL